MDSSQHGALIIIGGHEEKTKHPEILKAVVDACQEHEGHLLLVTAATELPEQLATEYNTAFSELGVDNLEVLDIRTRDDAYNEANVEKVQHAATIFFTGGDQLRITSQIGDSLVFRCMRERYQQGCTIAGTSAGAAAMPETMLIGGPGDESAEISALSMAPGLGLISGIVTDSHFAQRGRMGRLLGAIVQNPRTLGIGIDENPAINLYNDEFTVLGSGAVYVVDGSQISYSSLSEAHPEGIITIHDVRLHVLGTGDRYNVITRRPTVMEGEPAAA